MKRSLKSIVAMVLAVSVLAVSAIFSVGAVDCCPCKVSVSNSNELVRSINDVCAGGVVVLSRDIMMNQNLCISRSVILDLNGHELKFLSPEYACEIGGTYLDNGEYKYLDDFYVTIQNGTLRGADGDDGMNAWIGDAADGKNGGGTIRMISGNLNLYSSTIIAGDGGSGGEGGYASNPSGVYVDYICAGNGGNGGQGGTAIECTHGFINTTFSSIFSGNGGHGGKGGKNYSFEYRLGLGGKGGNAGNVAIIMDGKLNLGECSGLYGGNGGNGGKSDTHSGDSGMAGLGDRALPVGTCSFSSDCYVMPGNDGLYF